MGPLVNGIDIYIIYGICPSVNSVELYMPLHYWWIGPSHWLYIYIYTINRLAHPLIIYISALLTGGPMRCTGKKIMISARYCQKKNCNFLRCTWNQVFLQHHDRFTMSQLWLSQMTSWSLQMHQQSAPCMHHDVHRRILDQRSWINDLGSTILDQQSWINNLGSTILDQQSWINNLKLTENQQQRLAIFQWSIFNLQ